MNHLWHPPPPAPPPPPPPPPPPQPPHQLPGNVCPTCSISHFPFCPPLPPSYYQNPRFESLNDPYFYQRPTYDPFFDDRHHCGGGPPLPPPPTNLYRPSSDGYGDPPPPPWHRNPSLDSQFGDSFHSLDHGSDSVGLKRIRVDDSRASGEDERRLKLIREHGGAAAGPPQESRPYLQENLGHGNDIPFNQPKNFDSNYFRNPEFGNFGIKKRSLGQEFVHGDSNEGVGQGNGYSGHLAAYSEEGIRYNMNSSNPYDEPSSFPRMKRDCDTHLQHPYSAMQQPVDPKQEFHFRQQGDINQTFGQPNYAVVSRYGIPHNVNKQSDYLLVPPGTSSCQSTASGVFNARPPLPASPPPTLPLEPYRLSLSETSSSLFPVAGSSSANVSSSLTSVSEVHSVLNYYPSKLGFAVEEYQAVRKSSSNNYLGDSQPFSLRTLSSDKAKIVDALHIFKHPHRATRPDHIVIILRGLPGSGKSYLAKMLRDLEVENGGTAPRIHSMDDYFMTEVEKVEESEVSRSSASVRVKKPVTKKVLEYCYEPEMEEAYRSSMLKAFKKTLDEGVFSFIIVDDRNLRVADFAQFWATAKSLGYEVYLLEATYKDPAGCAARNVHGFSQDDIHKMAGKWEEAPLLYLKLDIKSLLHGDAWEETGIQEVDMDMEDGDPTIVLSGSEARNSEVISSHVADSASADYAKDDARQDASGDHAAEEVKELGKSKWSNDLDEDDAKKIKMIKGSLTAVSSLAQAYGKGGKSVRWGDQVGITGFSIAAAKMANVISLVIGPGSGYNLKTNPLPEEEKSMLNHYSGESKRQSLFQERLRAEHESFRAVFDRRKRISGFDADEE